MKNEVQITFRDMPPSPALEAKIHEEVGKLERVFSGIISCRVVVETPHRSHAQGKLFNVRIDLVVPGKELAVTHEHRNDPAHEDVNVAVRDAFRAARRQLESYVERQRGV